MARSVVGDPRLFGLAWPVFGLTAAASTFAAGWALRRASRLKVWAVSHLLMGVGVLLPSVWLSGFSIAMSALMVGGTFMIVTMVGVQEMRARGATNNATMLVGRATAAFALGQIAGPIASSLLLHMPGLAMHGLSIALQLASFTLLATAAWLWRFDTRIAISPEMFHAR
jgi:predicted MFS family arabinose efflux permease